MVTKPKWKLSCNKMATQKDTPVQHNYVKNYTFILNFVRRILFCCRIVLYKMSINKLID